MIVILFRVLMVQNVPQDLNQSLHLILVKVRVRHYQLIEHVYSSKNHRSLFVIEGLHGYRPDILDRFGISLIDVKENEKAFASDY